jgi:hypothetical protein
MAMVEVAFELKDFSAGRDLLDADTQRNLYAGFPEILLFVAVKLDHSELVSELVDELIHKGLCCPKPPFPDEDCRYPTRHNLLEPFHRGNIIGAAHSIEVAQLLLRAGADVNAQHCKSDDCRDIGSPIKHAAWKENPELVRFYLQCNANLKEFSFWFYDILFEAVATCNSELVTCLLDTGANIGHYPQVVPAPLRVHPKTNNHYKTMLQLAASLGSAKLMGSLLVKKEARHELQTGKFRWAPLRDAAISDHLEIVKQLISAGAEVNAEIKPYLTPVPDVFQWDDSTRTVCPFPAPALVAAVEGGHLDVVKELILNQADVNPLAFSEHGLSALEVAHKLKYWEIAQYLKEHGAIH